MTDSELLQALFNDMQTLKLDTQALKLNTQALKLDTQTLKQVTLDLSQKVSNLEDNVMNIKVTLDNEIRVNIQRVAEGHLDLSRNLHKAMKPSNEVEMLAIKVRQLESDMR